MLERRIIAPLLIALATVAALLAPTPPAAAAAPPYVALGDSYSSGTGIGSYLDDGTSCQRSVHAYPSLLATQKGYELNFRACSGATISDVTNAQLGALSSATRYVTISVGGNDAGFADVLTECATPWWAGDCDGAVDGAQAFINSTLPGRLDALYAAIRAAAPSARVVVVGYPRIFNGEDCNAATWFSPEEEARLNGTADLLNSRLAGAASARGFGFADPTGAFIGHAVCDDPEWINGLSWPISESYHPNASGHASGYAPTVSPLLTGAPARVTSRTLSEARESADELAAQQRRYADVDAAIRPESFRAPDLTTRAARRAAREHGIDLQRWLARQS